MEEIELLESTLDPDTREIMRSGAPGYILVKDGAGWDTNYEWVNPDWCHIFKNKEDAEATRWVLTQIQPDGSLDGMWTKATLKPIKFTSTVDLSLPQLKAFTHYLEWIQNARCRHRN